MGKIYRTIDNKNNKQLNGGAQIYAESSRFSKNRTRNALPKNGAGISVSADLRHVTA